MADRREARSSKGRYRASSGSRSRSTAATKSSRTKNAFAPLNSHRRAGNRHVTRPRRARRGSRRAGTSRPMFHRQAVPPRPELAGRKRGVVFRDDETRSILAQHTQDPEVGAVDVDDEHVGLFRHARFGEECEHVVGPRQRLPHRHVEVAGERGGGLRAQRVGLEPVSAPAPLGQPHVQFSFPSAAPISTNVRTANLDALEQRRDQPVFAVFGELRSLRRVRRRDQIGAWAHRRTSSATARSASACCRRPVADTNASARRALRRRPDNTERSGGKGPAFVSLRTVMEPATLRPEQGFLRPGRLP